MFVSRVCYLAGPVPTCSVGCDIQRGPLKASVEVQCMALLNEAVGGRASVKKVIGDVSLKWPMGSWSFHFLCFSTVLP